MDKELKEMILNDLKSFTDLELTEKEAIKNIILKVEYKSLDDFLGEVGEKLRIEIFEGNNKYENYDFNLLERAMEFFMKLSSYLIKSGNTIEELLVDIGYIDSENTDILKSIFAKESNFMKSVLVGNKLDMVIKGLEYESTTILIPVLNKLKPASKVNITSGNNSIDLFLSITEIDKLIEKLGESKKELEDFYNPLNSIENIF